MSKLPKTLNKFNRSHAGLRKFLRLVSYGCYHRTLFSRHDITPRTYDDLLRQIRFFVPEQNLQVTHYDKYSYFTFVGDFRHGTKNYYYSSFLLKTLLPEHCLKKIILLQVLECKKALSMSEILSRAEDAVIDYDPARFNEDLTQTFRRRFNELTDSGIVRRIATKNKALYEKIPNPFGELSANEIRILYGALKFFRNVSLIGTAGYFLCDSLKNLYDLSDPVQELFQFKNNNFARILDDDILLTITEAVRYGKKISVSRENKLPAIFTPLGIETDFLFSRQYLVALRQGELMRLRVEKITEVNLVKDDVESFSTPRQKLREVKLRVKFQNSEERRLREKLLSEELPLRIVAETTGEFTCIIEMIDPLQIYPRLWKFQPWAEILVGANGLRERMKRDAEEALKNYAEPV